MIRPRESRDEAGNPFICNNNDAQRPLPASAPGHPRRHPHTQGDLSMYESILRRGAAVGGTRKVCLAISLVAFGAGGLLAGASAFAQDPVKVDPKHYKVEFENSEVRVLRISYGPHEKSVMHHHPNSVAIYLADGQARMTTPDGKSQTVAIKAGVAEWTPAVSHQPENVGDKPFEVILVELKSKKAPAK
jgi:quercetin dioxygenase-like cupin family protein